MVIRVALVLVLAAACKKGGEAPPSPLQDAQAKAVVIDAAIVADAAVASKEPPVAAKVAVGPHSACALLGDGTVRCWGKNDHGQLGDGSQQDSSTPVTPKLGGVKDLVVGDDNACALIDDTSVVCWGKIGFKEGSGDTLAPAAVPGVRGVVRIFLVGGAGCATEKDGALVCWGDVDPRGHITITGAHHAPTPVPGVDHVISLVPRGALREDGDLSLWLDDGAPVKAGLTRMLEIGQHGDLVCGLDTAGTVSCYGPATSPCAAAPPASKPKPKPKAKPAKPKPKPKKPTKPGGKPAKPEPPKPATPEPAEHNPVAFKLPVPPAKHLAFDAGVCVVSTGKQLICADVPHRCAPVRPWPALVTVDAMSGSCAKLVNATVRCGIAAAAAAPLIANVAGATQISATLSRGCALLADKHVVCWEGASAAAPVTF